MVKLKEFFASPTGQKLVKGFISILRNAVIVVAGLIVSGLVELFGKLELNPIVQALIVGFLKLVDETLHKTGIAEKGLTRF